MLDHRTQQRRVQQGLALPPGAGRHVVGHRAGKIRVVVGQNLESHPDIGHIRQGKPKKKFTNTSGSRASHVKARCTRFIHGEAPVHWKTVGDMIGTFRVTLAGT